MNRSMLLVGGVFISNLGGLCPLYFDENPPQLFSTGILTCNIPACWFTTTI